VGCALGATIRGLRDAERLARRPALWPAMSTTRRAFRYGSHFPLTRLLRRANQRFWHALCAASRCAKNRRRRGNRSALEGVAPAYRNAATSQGQIPNAHKERIEPVHGVAIRVRPRHMPWFEEAMTLEVSADKLRFVSNRVYEPGQTVAGYVCFRRHKTVAGNDDIPASIVSWKKCRRALHL